MTTQDSNSTTSTDPVPAALTTSADPSSPSANDFADQANTASPSLFVEFLDFLREYGAWWLTPLVIVLLLLAGAAYLGTSAAAPFIYPLF